MNVNNAQIKKYSEIDITLKLKEIDQLDSAILQFSKNTLMTKKICASILVAITTIILKVTENGLDISMYISALITLFIFWVIDSNSYFYQRKLRIRMTSIVNDLKQDGSPLKGFGMPLESDEKPSWCQAFFNTSQLFYIFGLVIAITLWILDQSGFING